MEEEEFDCNSVNSCIEGPCGDLAIDQSNVTVFNALDSVIKSVRIRLQTNTSSISEFNSSIFYSCWVPFDNPLSIELLSVSFDRSDVDILPVNISLDSDLTIKGDYVIQIYQEEINGSLEYVAQVSNNIPCNDTPCAPI